jgi:hypothetical protein
MDNKQEISTFISYVQVFLFVAVYVAIGYSLHLNANAYLLIGIPLMIAFQLVIRKKPLHQLWIRDNETFRLNKLGVMLGLCFLIFPATEIIRMIIANKYNFWAITYQTAALVGAFGAGYTFSNFTKKTWKEFFLCLLTAGVAGIIWMIISAWFQSILKKESMHFNVFEAVLSLLQYIPITFILEEVVFRGVLDAHICPFSKKTSIGSAFFISTLWGWWHLPVMPGDAPLIALIIILPITHCLVGVPLSIYWRRSGNMAVPGFTHAFIDAIRNGLLK